MANGTGWKEQYLNEEGKTEPPGTKDTEEIFFDRIAEEMKEVVRHFEEDNGLPLRGNHAKILVGIREAEFHVSPQIANDMRLGFLSEPGKVYRAHVRFSNASSESRNDDSKPDLRGVAVRVLTEQGEHDFLMTNAEPHHAKDAREAMVAIISSTKKDTVEDYIPFGGVIKEKLPGIVGALPYLVTHLGFAATRRIVKTLNAQMEREVKSLATETYWSRAPLAIGGVPDPERSVAVKYVLQPVAGDDYQQTDNRNLGRELRDRLGRGEVRFLLRVQRYTAPDVTPIEDATVSWPSTFETIAELVIPRDAAIDNAFADGLVFSPWNIDLNNFQPLGSMNRSRKKVYEASARTRRA